MNYRITRDCSTLTKREKEVLGCIAQGMSTKQIADKLCISTYTVATHRKNMLAKTASRNSSEMVVRYLKNAVA